MIGFQHAKHYLYHEMLNVIYVMKSGASYKYTAALILIYTH
jgi:hypothetical protein